MMVRKPVLASRSRAGKDGDAQGLLRGPFLNLNFPIPFIVLATLALNEVGSFLKSKISLPWICYRFSKVIYF